MRRYLLLLLIVPAIVAAQSPAPQQDAGQQPAVTFRAETNFVEVHAIVTDAKGAFVRDLTRDDFDIYENGRLQTPAVFSLIDLPIERPFTPVNPLNAGSAPGASEPVESDVRATSSTFNGRIYVLLMDDIHTNVTRSQAVRDAARKFIEQYLGVNDLAAVVYASGLQESGQELTNSRRLLVASINKFVGRKLQSAGAEKLAAHLQQSANDDADAEANGDTTGPRTQEGLQKAQQTKDPEDDQRGFEAVRTLRAVEDVSNWLSEVQGRRKALLLFSEGIDYDIYQPFDQGGGASSSAIVAATQQAVSAAQRANVNVYGIDPRGLNAFGDMIEISGRSDYPQLEYGTFRGFQHELLLAQESLMSLSDQTGGLAIVNSGDVVGGLGRIVLDNSRYYLLGYYSDSTKWSGGKFLKIQVKVKRPGLRVRARRGFLPPDPKRIAKAREADVKAGTTPALKAALSRPVPVGDLPLRVFASSFKGTGTKKGADANGSLLVALEIDGAGLKFQERDGRFNETIEVSIVAADQKAKVQGGDRQTFDLKLMPQTYEKVRRSGVRSLSRLDLPPGRYQLHVGAFESSGAAIGTVPYDVEVPDYSKMVFGMSGVLVTSSNAGSFATTNPDPQLTEVLPGGAPVVTRTFTPVETLAMYAEVYDNSGRQAHAIAVTTSVQDATSGQTVFEVRDRLAADASDRLRTHGLRTEIPLKGMKPGMYVLRVEATSGAAGQIARRAVLFEVK